MTELLNLKPSGIGYSVRMIHVSYMGNEIFQPVEVFMFIKNYVFREVLSSQVEEPQKHSRVLLS